MPYKRRYKPSRRVGRVGSALQTASQALTVAYGVKKLLNVEYKSHEVDIPTTISSTPNITNLSAIATGDDFNDRDGRKIKCVSLRYKGRISMHASANSSAVRMVIFRDNNGSTSIPGVTDLFASAATFLNNHNLLDDPQTNSRFSVLSDKIYLLSITGNQQAAYDIYVKLNSHMYFSGSAATDEGKGAIYLLFVSNEATNVPNTLGNSVLKFIDN